MILNLENLQKAKIEFVSFLHNKNKKHPLTNEMRSYLERYKKTKKIHKLSLDLKVLFLEWVSRSNRQHPDVSFLDQYIESHKENKFGITPETYFIAAKEFAPNILAFLKNLEEI